MAEQETANTDFEIEIEDDTPPDTAVVPEPSSSAPFQILSGPGAFGLVPT